MFGCVFDVRGRSDPRSRETPLNYIRTESEPRPLGPLCVLVLGKLCILFMLAPAAIMNADHTHVHLVDSWLGILYSVLCIPSSATYRPGEDSVVGQPTSSCCEANGGQQ